MAAQGNDKTSVLVLRDAEGNFYAVGEQTIRACRATSEQQQALQQIIGDHAVVGYDAGGGLVSLGAITVAPQINTNVGLNVAAANFAPVTQVIGQTGLNGFNFG